MLNTLGRFKPKRVAKLGEKAEKAEQVCSSSDEEYASFSKPTSTDDSGQHSKSLEIQRTEKQERPLMKLIQRCHSQSEVEIVGHQRRRSELGVEDKGSVTGTLDGLDIEIPSSPGSSEHGSSKMNLLEQVEQARLCSTDTQLHDYRPMLEGIRALEHRRGTAKRIANGELLKLFRTDTFLSKQNTPEEQQKALDRLCELGNTFISLSHTAVTHDFLQDLVSEVRGLRKHFSGKQNNPIANFLFVIAPFLRHAIALHDNYCAQATAQEGMALVMNAKLSNPESSVKQQHFGLEPIRDIHSSTPISKKSSQNLSTHDVSNIDKILQDFEGRWSGLQQQFSERKRAISAVEYEDLSNTWNASNRPKSAGIRRTEANIVTQSFDTHQSTNHRGPFVPVNREATNQSVEVLSNDKQDNDSVATTAETARRKLQDLALHEVKLKQARTSEEIAQTTGTMLDAPSTNGLVAPGLIRMQTIDRTDITCRICEDSVSADEFEEHMAQCLHQYRQFYTEQRLGRVREALEQLMEEGVVNMQQYNETVHKLKPTSVGDQLMNVLSRKLDILLDILRALGQVDGLWVDEAALPVSDEVGIEATPSVSNISVTQTINKDGKLPPAPELVSNTIAPQTNSNTIAPQTDSNTIEPQTDSNTIAPQTDSNPKTIQNRLSLVTTDDAMNELGPKSQTDATWESVTPTNKFYDNEKWIVDRYADFDKQQVLDDSKPEAVEHPIQAKVSFNTSQVSQVEEHGEWLTRDVDTISQLYRLVPCSRPKEPRNTLRKALQDVNQLSGEINSLAVELNPAEQTIDELDSPAARLASCELNEVQSIVPLIQDIIDALGQKVQFTQKTLVEQQTEADDQRVTQMLHRIKSFHHTSQHSPVAHSKHASLGSATSSTNSDLGTCQEHEQQKHAIVKTPSMKLFAEPRATDFELLKPISSGAYGRVFLATKKTTGDLYAIKILDKAEMMRKKQTAHIMAERNVLSRANCPYVVKLYFSFQTRHRLFLVMEFVRGGDLLTMLKDCTVLEEHVVRQYTAEIVVALKYLHESLGVCHRDLKPDNILLDMYGHIKLTDFGLSPFGVVEDLDLSSSRVGLGNNTDAVFDNDDEETDASIRASAQSLLRQSSNSSLNSSIKSPDMRFYPHLPNYDPKQAEANNTRGEKQSRRKQLRSRVGTPDYMAPEILLGTGHDVTCDWWSLGIIVYELLCGFPPFHDDSPEKIFKNILNFNLAPIPDDVEVSEEAVDLIVGLLMKKPHKRLGAKGAIDVQNMPFFKGIKWSSLERGEFIDAAPFIPNLQCEADTSYFNDDNDMDEDAMSEIIREEMLDSPTSSVYSGDDDNMSRDSGEDSEYDDDGRESPTSQPEPNGQEADDDNDSFVALSSESKTSSIPDTNMSDLPHRVRVDSALIEIGPRADESLTFHVKRAHTLPMQGTKSLVNEHHTSRSKTNGNQSSTPVSHRSRSTSRRRRPSVEDAVGYHSSSACPPCTSDDNDSCRGSVASASTPSRHVRRGSHNVQHRYDSPDSGSHSASERHRRRGSRSRLGSGRLADDVFQGFAYSNLDQLQQINRNKMQSVSKHHRTGSSGSLSSGSISLAAPTAGHGSPLRRKLTSQGTIPVTVQRDDSHDAPNA